MNQFFRFGFIGAGGFVVDSATLFILHRKIGLDPYSARAISIFLAMNFTWMGNRLFTFRAHAASGAFAMAAEWTRFVATNALGALLNYGVYAAFIRFAPSPANNIYVALVAGVATGLIFNFTLSRRLVFRAPPTT